MTKKLPGPPFYKAIYMRFGGKPFTWVVRKFQKRSPLAVMLAFVLLGIIVALTGQWWGLLWLIIGIVLGHFWW